MAPKTDITWDHCARISGKNRMQLKCNYCGREFWGGVTRMKHHLACTRKDIGPCSRVSEEVQCIFLDILKGKQANCGDIVVKCFDGEVSLKEEGKHDCFVAEECIVNQQTVNEMVSKRDPVIRSICRFLYGSGLSFDLVENPLFVEMLKSIGEYGIGLTPPTYHEVSVTYLDKEVEIVREDLKEYRKEWKKTGCSLILDGWTDKNHRSMINFLVNSPRGTVFIKSVDTSLIIKSSKKMFRLLDEIVEEIGEENVVQVVTDSNSSYEAAMRLLMKKRKNLFWSLCATHLIDLILGDISELPVFKDTIEKAKKVSNFIYQHVWVLELYRKHSTQRELTRPAIMSSATSFLTLESFQDQKDQLKAMFSSEEWASSSQSRFSMGRLAREIILENGKFWNAIKYCVQSVSPLVKVLRLVNGDSKPPPMGYVYEAMDRAKEEIACNLKKIESRYRPIWKIIDDRWDLQLDKPLHAAGYYLNPRFHYDDKFNPDKKVKIGLYHTIERMYPDVTRLKIDEQLEKFTKAEGLFGMSMATITRDRKQPALWWETFGDDCPELQSFAIRVLSLTCSATGCERNWNTFDIVHSKKGKHLEQQRLDSFLFVKYNIQLNMRRQKRQEQGETYDPICLSDMEPDDEWIMEKEDPCLPKDHSCLDVQECNQDDELVDTKKRKRGSRILHPVKKENGRTC